MNWYTIKEWKEVDPLKFEKDIMSRIGLIDEILPRYRNTYFSHIFAGGYDAGYYNYIWADVLVADAFQAFKENGLFDQKTAKSLRENILEKGGSEDPMKLFVKFRGREPKIEPLIAKRGLDQQ
jgi:peptidyl-dipeptidase Dcp